MQSIGAPTRLAFLLERVVFHCHSKFPTSSRGMKQFNCLALGIRAIAKEFMESKYVLFFNWHISVFPKCTSGNTRLKKYSAKPKFWFQLCTHTHHVSFLEIQNHSWSPKWPAEWKQCLTQCFFPFGQLMPPNIPWICGTQSIKDSPARCTGSHL